jgi:hypothetical protein
MTCLVVATAATTFISSEHVHTPTQVHLNFLFLFFWFGFFHSCLTARSCSRTSATASSDSGQSNKVGHLFGVAQEVRKDNGVESLDFSVASGF